MTYSHMQPVGYLGGAGGAPDSSEEIVLRNQARANAIAIWNDYQRLRRQGPVQELMAAEPFSSSALTRALGALREAAGSRVSVRLPKRVYASLLQSAMAKISSLQIKARTLSRAADIRAVYPAVERVNAAARRLLTAANRLVSEANPLRKEAAPGKSGLGFIIEISLIGAFVVGAGLALYVTDAFDLADEAREYADRVCAQQQRATGSPCGAQDWAAAYEEGMELAQQSGLPGLVRMGAEGVRNLAEPGRPIFEGIGTGAKVAIIVGAVGVLGMAAYAAWPYLAGVRGAGKRFARATGD